MFSVTTESLAANHMQLLPLEAQTLGSLVRRRFRGSSIKLQLQNNRYRPVCLPLRW
jgi:hypothetical protein